MPRPRKVIDQYAKLFADVFKARQQIPNDKELARRAGVSRETVRNYMRHISVDSHGANDDTITSQNEVSFGHVQQDPGLR